MEASYEGGQGPEEAVMPYTKGCVPQGKWLSVNIPLMHVYGAY